MYEHGNAAWYATWIDESLNLTLRSIARCAHPSTFDVTVLAAFALISELGLNKYLSATEEDSDSDL